MSRLARLVPCFAKWLMSGVLSASVLGCACPPACDRATVSHAVESRFGQSVGPPPKFGRAIVPEGVEAGRPLGEDEAVLLALFNNAAFQEALVELDITRADLVQAGLLPNPEFVYFWSVADKPFKYALEFPIEALWLRPLRLKAAAAENARACARVTQLALDLIRDTRLAYVDLQLAQDQRKVAERAVTLRSGIAKLAEGRFKADDATPLVVSTARVDVLQAEQDLIRARAEVAVVGERLRNFTGLSGFGFAMNADDRPFEPRTTATADELVVEAIASRPDAAAASHAARAAAERLGVAKLGWVRFLGILDATSGRNTGHEFGPALRFTVPLFNRNQGGIARAAAEFDQLDRRRQTVCNQIVLDVRTAHARYLQARAELDQLRSKTRPEVELTIRQAEAEYKEGDATYLIVLEANRQLVTTYAREAQLASDLRRAWAELERGVGRRLIAPVEPAPQ